MPRKVAALYIDPKRGPYPHMADVQACGLPDCDAMAYVGPHPVVAHPPCAPWGRLAWSHDRCKARGGRSKDGEREAGVRAVEQVRRWGGVLEHPKASRLWPFMSMAKPGKGLDEHGCWTLETEQVRWGHQAEKKTWLYICGVPPEDVPGIPPWQEPTRVVTKNKDPAKRAGQTEMSHSRRHLTPVAFAEWLVELTRRVQR